MPSCARPSVLFMRVASSLLNLESLSLMQLNSAIRFEMNYSKSCWSFYNIQVRNTMPVIVRRKNPTKHVSIFLNYGLFR